MRQMHNYVDLDTAFNGQISQQGNNEELNTTIRGAKKVGEDASNEAMEERMRKMKEDRDSDIKTITGNKPPMSF